MADTSPIVLHIKAGDRPFDFFLFSLAVYDSMLYNKAYNPNAPSAAPSGTMDEVFNKLQALFLEAPEQETGAIALTFTHLLVLLSIVDHISKALLDVEADRLINFIANKFPDLEDNWVTGYLQNAGHIFGAFRQQFSNMPKIEALLERITSLNQFQEKGSFLR